MNTESYLNKYMSNDGCFVFEGPLTGRFLLSIAKKVASQPYEIGQLLNIEYERIQAHAYDYPRDCQRVTNEVLIDWVRKSVNSSNVITKLEELIGAVEQLNRVKAPSKRDVTCLVKEGEYWVGLVRFHREAVRRVVTVQINN